MAQVVYTGVAAGADVRGSLFQGAKFWLSQRVPSRATFIEQIKSNGGEIVPLEKNADVKIVDHLKQDNVPGTYSYQYIERSVRNGQLEDLEKYRAGPSQGAVRPAGAIDRPPKGTRTAFTAEDDGILYDWVDESSRNGGYVLGNELYKQLEKINPRHTWQSWRDRWVKILSSRSRPVRAPTNAPPTPPTDQPDVPVSKSQIRTTTPIGAAFTSEDAQALLALAKDIMNIPPENLEAAWKEWADSYPQHSVLEWRNFWESNIKPVYRKREKTLRSANEVEPEILTSPTGFINPARTINPSVRLGRSGVLKETTSYQEARNTSIKKQSKNAGGANSPTDEEVLDSCRSPKRRHTELPAEVPSSSPPNRLSTPPAKRRRLDSGSITALEIPSTPEKSPLSLRLAVRPRIQRSIIDLEEDDPEYEEEAVNEGDDEEEEYDNEEYENDSGERAASQSLSEPDRALTEIRSIFRDPGMITRFDVPSPEVGWGDNEDEQGGGTPNEGEEKVESVEIEAKIGDTQAILQGQTPAFDFLVAEPEEGWDVLMNPPPSSPPVPISALGVTYAINEEEFEEPPMTEKEIIAQVEEWMDDRVARGIEVDDIGLALKCANNHPVLADMVLESLQRGEGIPTDVQGIWTEEDDECLEAVDTRLINSMIEKHGQKELDKRYDFLRYYNAT
ncbi:hypothetical protein MMC13_007087 [Lambiella insularis]|nr:hypothetical protein [Lambiella insularis]